MKIDWVDGFEIRADIDTGGAVISANREGLLSLARQLTALAEEPAGSHIHYDENNSLEAGSAELIIEKRDCAHMKKRTFRTGNILSWLLLFCLLFSCSGTLAETGPEGEELSDFQNYLQNEWKYRRELTPSDLFRAARSAEGDRLANFAEAQRYAAELGIARQFAFDTEDAIAKKNGSTGWIMAGYDDYWLTDSKEPAFIGIRLTEEVEQALASEEARAFVPAALCTDQRFREIYGVSMKDFRPSRPRSGVCLLTLSPSAHGWPEMPASADGKAMAFAVDDTKKMLRSLTYRLEDNQSVLQVTGNPDTASVIIEMDIRFTFAGDYGARHHGYNKVYSLTAFDAKTRKKIADFSVKSYIGYSVKLEKDNHIDDYIWADFPSFPTRPLDQKTEDLIKFANTLEKYAAKSVQTDNTTPQPFGALYALLEEESRKTKDPWLKAVLSSGARDYRIRDGQLSFTLRSGNPRTDALTGEADDPAAFLTQAGQNALAHNLMVTVMLQDGFIGKKTRQDILTAAKRGAADSKKAFADRKMTEILRKVYFPAPSGKFKKPEDIAEAASSMPASAFFYPYEDPAAAAVRFYGVKKCTLDVSHGPDQLSLTVTGLTRDPLAIPLNLSDLAHSGFSEAYEAMLRTE